MKQQLGKHWSKPGDIMKEIAKFNVGERVIHLKLGYRAVIIDVDPFFLPMSRLN